MAKKSTKKAVKRAAKKAAPAGRPAGTGRYGVPTKTVRVPVELEEAVADFCRKTLKKQGK